MPPPSRRREHLGVLLAYTALTLLFTWPLAGDLSRLTGAYGDGPMFLWDLWWFRHAVAVLHQSPFHCDLIMAPFGADLYLHTLTPARGLQAMLLTPLVGLVAAHNLLFLSSFVLAGYGMCRLGRALGLPLAAAFLAGCVYAFSSYHFARGYGHFNLTEIQWFPFYFLSLIRALDGRRIRHVLLAAAFLLLVAYSDYYYLVYALLLTALHLGWRWARPAGWRRLLEARTRSERWLRALILGDVAVIAVALAAGGISWEMDGLRVHVHRLERPMLLLLVLLAGRLVLEWRRSGRMPAEWLGDLRTTAAICGLVLVGFSPVLAGAAASASDPAGLLAYSPVFSRLYAANLQGYLIPGSFELDRSSWIARLWPPSDHLLESGIEGKYSLGLLTLALAAIGAVAGWKSAWVRFFVLAALVFLDLSLGPTLHVGSSELWTELPRRQLLLYHWLLTLPFASGVRVPSRFAVLVSFAVAVLAAFGLERLCRAGTERFGRRLGAIAALGLLLGALVEEYPGRFHGRRLEVPRGYRVLPPATAGVTLLDVPLLWSSGVTGYGADELSLFYQTAHEMRVFSGSVSRLAERRFDQLFALPVVGAVMSIQEGCDPDAWLDDASIARAREFLARERVDYAVLRWDEPSTSARMAAVDRYLDAVAEWRELYRDAYLCVLARRGS